MSKRNLSNTEASPFLKIVANDIVAWASSIRSRSRFSVFLRILVNSTNTQLLTVDFPGNDDSERPGWDGWVVASKGTPWIPGGQSGWELGTNKNPQLKADKDYDKSLKEAYKKKTTFVFVTPQRWPAKKAWVKARIAEGVWKSVKVYDAGDLEQWLEQSIAGQIWFANEANHTSKGIRSLDKCWTDWANVTQPPLVSDFFRQSIESAKEKTVSIFLEPPKDPIQITADSTEEAVAFIAALFSSEERLGKYRDRIIVIDAPGILPKLASISSSFIAVVTAREVEKELAPFCSTIHAIIIYPRNAIHDEPFIQLQPLDYETFHDSLRKMGVDRDKATRLESESGRSLTVLRRRLSEVFAIKTPEWAGDNTIAAQLVPFLFAGTWNANNNCDRIILSSLAKEKDYDDLEKSLQELSKLNDAPVWSIGSVRGLISKIDVLFAISGTITSSELETYFDVARLVLSEDDPSLDLPENDRPFALVYGKAREISQALRTGICETLVLLSIHGDGLFQKRLGVSIEAKSIVLLRQLLSDPLTTRILKSHNRDLPTYAEVAPNEFLTILEKDIKRPDSACIGLLYPVEAGIFNECPRTGLLWALENLAWSSVTFLRSVLVLAKLSETKIEDNWSNKPIASLKDIFRFWMPQTGANLNERIKAIELLIHRFPKVAWQICIDQFGPYPTIGGYTHKPRWRNDAQGFGYSLGADEIRPFVNHIIDLVLKWNEYDRSMLGDIIERLDVLDDSRQQTVWNIIGKWSASANDNDKAWIRNHIRIRYMSRKGVIRLKKRPTSNLEEIVRTIYSDLEPKDIVNKHEWLFRDGGVEETYDEMEGEAMDIRLRAARIRKLRREALTEIIADDGFNGILRLTEMGDTAIHIGDILPEIVPMDQTTDFILNLAEQGSFRNSFRHRGLIMGCFRSFEDDNDRSTLLTDLKKSLSPENFIRIIQLAPFRTSTWSFVKEMDSPLQTLYWKEVQPTWDRQNSDELNEIVEQLIAVKRPSSAFRHVFLDLDDLRPTLLYRLLQEITKSEEDPNANYHISSDAIQKAVRILHESRAFSAEEMVSIEIGYVEFLGDRHGEDSGTPNLEEYVNLHPDFFASLIAYIYKRSDDGVDPEGIKLDDPKLIAPRARRADTLIENLRQIPGTDGKGVVEASRLSVWVSQVRKTCQELGRQKMGDLTLGKLLSKAPNGIDGIWPCEPVRVVLEEIQSEEICRGIINGLYNSRGIHGRGNRGDQERGLAKMYRTWASAIEPYYPFVSTSILKRMADSYDWDAQREDTQADIERRLR